MWTAGRVSGRAVSAAAAERCRLTSCRLPRFFQSTDAGVSAGSVSVKAALSLLWEGTAFQRLRRLYAVCSFDRSRFDRTLLRSKGGGAKRSCNAQGGHRQLTQHEVLLLLCARALLPEKETSVTGVCRERDSTRRLTGEDGEL